MYSILLPFLPNKLNFCCANYSREETIWGNSNFVCSQIKNIYRLYKSSIFCIIKLLNWCVWTQDCKTRKSSNKSMYWVSIKEQITGVSFSANYCFLPLRWQFFWERNTLGISKKKKKIKPGCEIWIRWHCFEFSRLHAPINYSLSHSFFASKENLRLLKNTSR